MKMTCKELAEILLKTPNHFVTVSIDDGCGMQCDADINEVQTNKSEVDCKGLAIII